MVGSSRSAIPGCSREGIGGTSRAARLARTGGLDEAVMTWDAKDGYVLLFGGARSGTAASADTWSFIHGTWTNMTHSIAPPARYGGVLAYDAYAGYVVLFGGQSPSSPYILGDDSIYVGGTWS